MSKEGRRNGLNSTLSGRDENNWIHKLATKIGGFYLNF
jgi:hypothetical protein